MDGAIILDAGKERGPQVLPDTPDWSPARRGTVALSLATGIGLTLLGAAGSLWHMTDTIATTIINAGTTIVLSASGLHVGAASLERVGAWWLNRNKGA